MYIKLRLLLFLRAPHITAYLRDQVLSGGGFSLTWLPSLWWAWPRHFAVLSAYLLKDTLLGPWAPLRAVGPMTLRAATDSTQVCPRLKSGLSLAAQ